MVLAQKKNSNGAEHTSLIYFAEFLEKTFYQLKKEVVENVEAEVGTWNDTRTVAALILINFQMVMFTADKLDISNT